MYRKLGNTIRLIHLGLPYFLLVVICNKKQQTCNYIIITILGIIIIQRILIKNRCIISELERKLLNNNKSIIDDYLLLFNMPVTNYNRSIVSNRGIVLFILLGIIIYIYRFGN